MDAVQVSRTANYASNYPPHRVAVSVAFMDSERGVGFLPEEHVNITPVWETKLKMLLQHRRLKTSSPATPNA